MAQVDGTLRNRSVGWALAPEEAGQRERGQSQGAAPGDWKRCGGEEGRRVPWSPLSLRVSSKHFPDR